MKIALASRLARSEPYNLLNQQQWRDLAEHVYKDERVPRAEGTGATFLSRGTQNGYGHGRRQVLNGILCSAITDHSGVEGKVPHYEAARDVHAAVRRA